MVSGYNPNEEKWLLDANNLYGWAMSNPQPTGGFRMLCNEEIADFDPWEERTTKGYYLEVDLEIRSEVGTEKRIYNYIRNNISVDECDVTLQLKKTGRGWK
jgi:hypothetical protein